MVAEILRCRPGNLIDYPGNERDWMEPFAAGRSATTGNAVLPENFRGAPGRLLKRDRDLLDRAAGERMREEEKRDGAVG
jgi:hypothetical protein